jgi:RNA polymerase primary sigma factor
MTATIRRLVHHPLGLDRRVRRIANEHLVATGVALTRRELAAAAGTTVADVELLSRAVRTPVSLSVPVDDDGTELADILAAPGDASPDEEASGAALGDEVEALVGLLRPREQAVVRARFGIGQAPQKLEEVATVLGVTRERVRQIEARAMARLRVAARDRGTQSLLLA